MTDAVTPPNPADPSLPRNGSRSVPDPSLMTIDALRREIAMQVASTEKGLDAAHELTAEKFRRVDDLMERAEEMRREQKSDTAAAVDAALESQKEATAKMEKSISDQIASLRTNFDTSIGSIQSNVNDLKERMTTLESVRQGQAEQRTETRAITAGQIAAISVGVAVLLAVLTIIAFIAGSSSLPPSELSLYSHLYT